MIEINARFTPYRLILERRAPVELMIELVNKGDKEKLASLEIVLGRQLSLDRVGYKATDLRRIPAFKPGEKKFFYYKIWPKGINSSGEETVIVKAMEHHENYNLLKKEFMEKLNLKIE